jgi:hypothetical protein
MEDINDSHFTICWFIHILPFTFYHYTLDGGFQTFVIFHVLYGMSSFPLTNSYVSEGLKPPTSICCLNKHGFLQQIPTKPIHWGPQRALAVPSGRVLGAVLFSAFWDQFPGDFTFRNMDLANKLKLTWGCIQYGDFTDNEEVTRVTTETGNWWYPMGYFIETIQCKLDQPTFCHFDGDTLTWPQPVRQKSNFCRVS